MVFSSTVFLFLFLPALLILYYFPIKVNRNWRNGVLLLFSLGFYAWGEPVFVFLMIFAILVNWFAGLQMQRDGQGRKPWMIAAIGFDVLMLGIFKYTSFLSKNLAALMGNNKLIVEIALPIGISFFTFQLMSYIFDIYYGHAAAQKNPLYVALYISLFPQLIAGPIVRYKQIENEIRERQESFSEFSAGTRRFIYGLGKKMLLANFLAPLADNAFDYFSSPSVMSAWLGAIAYTMQIYFDFSGYSDMAIGLGRMFGFHFAENFRYPYIAGSVTEFWRRWHISLSTWFRDYIYIPLGGNRVSKSRWVFNMFVVWLLTGIWHGANWTFVLWGLLYFAVLVLEKQSGIAKRLGSAGKLYTMLIVILAWVFFRASDISSACRYIGCMFGFGSSAFLDNQFISAIKGTYIVLFFSLVGVTPFLAKAFDAMKKRGLAWIEAVWLVVIFSLSVLEIISSTYNPFIYFNF